VETAGLASLKRFIFVTLCVSPTEHFRRDNIWDHLLLFEEPDRSVREHAGKAIQTTISFTVLEVAVKCTFPQRWHVMPM
jgi:hypothetical protein